MFAKCVIILVMMMHLGMYAEDNVESLGESCRKPERSIAAFDSFHTFCTEGIVRLANKIDYFFGRIRVDEESNETYARVTFQTEVTEGRKIQFSTRQRIRLNLPGTEKKIKLIFDKNNSDDEDNSPLSLSEEQANNQRNNGFDTAIRYVVKRKARWNTNIDGGVRVRRTRPFNPFTRLRNRFNWEISNKMELRFTNSFLYFMKTYGVIETRIDLDRSLSGGALFRFSNYASWEDRNDYFDFFNAFSFFQEISERRAIGYHIEAVGNNMGGHATYTRYSVYMQYRQLIYKDWLFVELRPEVRLPKEDHFNPELYLGVNVEFRFGNY